MVKQLDESIKELVVAESLKVEQMDEERVEELLEYWEERMPKEDEYEFKLTLDYNEKRLMWIWARLRRAHAARASAGREYMMVESVDGDAGKKDRTDDDSGN